MKRRLDWLVARPIAHRGFHDIASGHPENSLAAFEAAIASRYAIECDLHPSADGVPMVFHDDALLRVTGAEGCIRDRTVAELSTLSLLGTREPLPQLSDLLTLTRGRVPLVIELKHMPGRDAGFAASVVRQLAAYDGPVALMSFDSGLLADVKSAGPDLPRGLTAAGDFTAGRRHLNVIMELGVDFISYAIDHLPTLFPIIANRVFRIPLICWTVRTSQQLKTARTWTDQITFEGFTP